MLDRPPPPTHPLLRPALTLLWLGGIATGLALLFDYDATPGGTGAPPLQWPQESELERPADRPTLVLFAHPRCPCTRATLYELERLQARCPRLCIHVVFAVPADAAADSWQTELWQQARAITGTRVHRDQDGSETRRFHALTSGHALLYEPGGVLAFTGGITSARGHAGDNAGADAIASVVQGAVPAVRRTSVYGCGLQDPQAAPPGGER